MLDQRRRRWANNKPESGERQHNRAGKNKKAHIVKFDDFIRLLLAI